MFLGNSRVFVVDVLTEARGINDGEANPHSIFIQLDIDWLDPDPLFDVSGLWVVRSLVTDDL